MKTAKDINCTALHCTAMSSQLKKSISSTSITISTARQEVSFTISSIYKNVCLFMKIFVS